MRGLPLRSRIAIKLAMTETRVAGETKWLSTGMPGPAALVRRLEHGGNRSFLGSSLLLPLFHAPPRDQVGCHHRRERA